MSTAAWREEKSGYVVKAICRTLASDETPVSIKQELAGEALWNALKLFSDALQERLCTEQVKWSPGLVELFTKDPSRCEEWLQLMSESEFSTEDYWNRNNQN